MRSSKMLVSFALILALAGASCGGEDEATFAAGSIDGTWQINSVTCNGSSTSFLGGATSMNLIISGATGSFVTAWPSSCVATEGNTYAYSGTATFALTTVNRVCSGTCSGAECTDNGSITDPATVETVSRTGNTMTFTHTSDGTTDPCTSGQTAVFTFIKQ
jgi:hypothetical protein